MIATRVCPVKVRTMETESRDLVLVSMEADTEEEVSDGEEPTS